VRRCRAGRFACRQRNRSKALSLRREQDKARLSTAYEHSRRMEEGNLGVRRESRVSFSLCRQQVEVRLASAEGSRQPGRDFHICHPSEVKLSQTSDCFLTAYTPTCIFLCCVRQLFHSQLFEVVGQEPTPLLLRRVCLTEHVIIHVAGLRSAISS